MNQPTSACPHCRSTKLTQLATKSGHSFTMGPDGEDLRIPQTMFVFQCECGVAFTHTVKGKPVDREPLAGLPVRPNAVGKRPTLAGRRSQSRLPRLGSARGVVLD
jgi:hypothetical protein